jgi:hypothetical protein
MRYRAGSGKCWPKRPQKKPKLKIVVDLAGYETVQSCQWEMLAKKATGKAKGKKYITWRVMRQYRAGSEKSQR